MSNDVTRVDSAFTGRGFAYPFSINARGGMAMVQGTANVEQAIRLILGTAYGERPMRPEFGCAIHDMVFEPSTPDLVTRIQIEVEQSLVRWEPRIDVLGVQVMYDGDPSRLLIDIQYQLKGSYDPRNLLVPFYLIPSEEQS